MDKDRLIKVHEQYIKGIPDGAAVILEIFQLVTLTEKVQSVLNLTSPKIYLKTWALKHMYERRPASVYDFLLQHVAEIVRYPNFIYRNSSAKKGHYALAKRFEEGLFMVSLEVNAHPETGEEVHVIVTAFKVEQRYLDKYERIWSWEDGDASS